MNILVTSDDIYDGKKRDPCRCPVARALCRHYQYAIVNTEFLSFGNSIKGRHWQVPTPLIVEDFIFKFDCGLLPKPFMFDLPDFVDRDK